MKTETVKAIFTNLLFVIGVVLVIIGASRGLLTATRLVVFDKYPLNSYEETRCEMESFVPRPISDAPVAADRGEMERNKENCLSAIEHERKVRVVEDVVSSLTMLVGGIVLTLSFRRFIFGRN